MRESLLLLHRLATNNETHKSRIILLHACNASRFLHEGVVAPTSLYSRTSKMKGCKFSDNM